MILKNYTKFGATEAGEGWCQSALDPAHPRDTYHGYPDDDCNPLVSVTYKNQYEISSPSTTVATWNAQICVTGGILKIGGVEAIASDSSATSQTILPNAQVTGATDTLQMQGLVNSFRKYRMVKGFTTITFISSDMYNQGSLAAAHCVCAPQKLSYYVGPNTETTGVLWRNISMYNGNDLPSYTTLAEFPRVYKGATKDGVYMPFKLNDQAREWHDMINTTVVTNNNSDANFVSYQSNHVLSSFTIQTAAPTYWPGSLYYTGSAVSAPIPFVPLVTDTVQLVQVKGISLNATIRINTEFTYELIPRESSTLMSFVQEHCPPDELAIVMYQAISQELCDAFPSSFNDFNQFWNVLKKVAGTVFKVVGPGLGYVVPGLPDVVKSIGNSVSSIVDNSLKTKALIKGRNRNRKRKPKVYGPPTKPLPPLPKKV